MIHFFYSSNPFPFCRGFFVKPPSCNAFFTSCQHYFKQILVARVNCGRDIPKIYCAKVMFGLETQYNVNFSYYFQPVGSDSWALPGYVEMVRLGVSTLPPAMPILWQTPLKLLYSRSDKKSNHIFPHKFPPLA